MWAHRSSCSRWRPTPGSSFSRAIRKPHAGNASSASPPPPPPPAVVKLALAPQSHAPDHRRTRRKLETTVGDVQRRHWRVPGPRRVEGGGTVVVRRPLGMRDAPPARSGANSGLSCTLCRTVRSTLCEAACSTDLWDYVRSCDTHARGWYIDVVFSGCRSPSARRSRARQQQQQCRPASAISQCTPAETQCTPAEFEFESSAPTHL